MEKEGRGKRTKRMERERKGSEWKSETKGEGKRRGWIKVRERKREDKDSKRNHRERMLAGERGKREADLTGKGREEVGIRKRGMRWDGKRDDKEEQWKRV